jgi:hypothetical protein
MFKIRDFTFFRHKITIFKQKSPQSGRFYPKKLANLEIKAYICTEFKHSQDEPILTIKPCLCGGNHHFNLFWQAYLYARQASEGEIIHGLCVYQYHP